MPAPPILHVSRNPNPRLAAASARYMGAKVSMVFGAPRAPGQEPVFRQLNPNLLLPILEDSQRTYWECDAVVCRLAMQIGSDFWPTDARLPDLIRWISWGKENFVRGCDMVHFELGTKRRYGLGPTDAKAVKGGTEIFHDAAALLDEVLQERDWLIGDGPTFADFRMATFLPFNDIMMLPVSRFSALDAWNARLEAISSWNDPFAGVEVPPLPPVVA